MDQSKTIVVRLSPELAEMVDSAVASGRYQSESDVVYHALEMMKIGHPKVIRAILELAKLYEKGVVDYAALQSRDPEAELVRSSPEQWKDIL